MLNIKKYRYKKILLNKYMNQNMNRRNLINSYLNLIDENNSNISNIVNVMNNQEITLRRLIFESNYNTQQSFSSLNSRQNILNRNNRLGNSFNLLYNPNTSLSREDYIQSLSSIDNLLDGFFNAVPIIPTSEQINNAIHSCKFSEINNPGNQVCSISLRTFQSNDEVSIIKYCNHIFSKNDLNSWFLHNTRCPLCRYDIRNYNNQNELNQNNSDELNQNNSDELNQNNSDELNQNNSDELNDE